MRLEKDHARKRMNVPILLPTGRDAELVGSILDQEQIDVIACDSMHDILNQVRLGCGPFVIGDEAFSDNTLYRLMEALDRQPEWSDLPGFIFIGRSIRYKTLDFIAARREINLIKRPVKMSLFTNMVQTAVEARRRQYQVRDLLAELVHTNEKLRTNTTLLQNLALELTRIEARERQHIARILHDDLQQMLAAAKLQTEMLFDYLKDEPAQKAQKVFDIISEAMKTSRSLSHEMNPAFIHGENFAGGEKLEFGKNEKPDVITVLIADDHAVMRQGLASLLRNRSDIEVVAEAADGEQAVALALQFRPAVVMMDFSMPLLNGADATRRIKKAAPEIEVIGLSMYAAQDKEKMMLDAGAQTYLTKDVQAKELIAAIKKSANLRPGVNS